MENKTFAFTGHVLVTYLLNILMNFKQDRKKFKKESDVISWANAAKYDLEVQHQGIAPFSG